MNTNDADAFHHRYTTAVTIAEELIVLATRDIRDGEDTSHALIALLDVHKAHERDVLLWLLSEVIELTIERESAEPAVEVTVEPLWRRFVSIPTWLYWAGIGTLVGTAATNITFGLLRFAG